MAIVSAFGGLAAAAPVVLVSAVRARVEPTPSGPVYGGVPGALPAGFHYRYNDSFRGWPVRPRLVQHPVRGSFLDPRGRDDDALAGYHFGIDVSVDDRRPERGAPRGLSHRVYALESGVVREPVQDRRRKCGNRRLDVGHFAYWHVSPIVREGQRVRPGEQIGWTCLGDWHVHVSEWHLYRGVRVWVNPLHAGGRLAPYTDIKPPQVGVLRFVTPPTRPWQPTTNLAQPDSSRPLRASDLHGLVELRAQIGDPQSHLGFLTQNRAWVTQFHPYRVVAEIRDAQTGVLVFRRVSFQSDQLPQTPYLVHYAPGTVEDDNMLECVGPPQLRRCAGVYWFRPFSRFHQEFWDTRAVRNGSYRVSVLASDLAGNVGTRSITVQVVNRL